MADAYTHVAISAGGLFISAHLGALQYLRDRRMDPLAYSASSCGSAIAALMAVGYEPHEVHTRTKKHPLSMYEPVHPGLGLKAYKRWGLFRPAGVEEVRKMLRSSKVKSKGDPTFRDLDRERGKSLSISAVAAASGRLVRFGHDAGTLDVCIHSAVAASCSIPVFNPPTRIGKQLYIDGAIAEYLPLQVFDSVPNKKRVVGLLIEKAIAPVGRRDL
jgi:predicted acylesterase/phospholipase RssA